MIAKLAREKSFIIFLVISAFFLIWHQKTTGNITLLASISLMLFTLLCFVYGEAFGVAASRLTSNNYGLVFKFLCGYFVFNTTLFVLELACPFGILANIFILTIAAVPLAFYSWRNRPVFNTDQEWLPSLLCIIISGTAATLWCNDAQVPLLLEADSVVFRTWKDTFIHIREVSSFAKSHGMESLYNIGLFGFQKSIYHYASYISAAAVYALTGATAMEVYSSFQLPFGIFLTGLAAYSLIASIWGAWPALAATVAILCIPDAYQQGFGNRYLSYSFLSQVNLSILYGISCVTIAWIFIFDGCARGKYITILIAYFFAVITVFYKAHIFIANAFLIMIYPCVFFHEIKLVWRLAIGIALIGLFVIVVNLSQNIQRIPVMRLDGSGFYPYISGLMANYDAGVFKDFFNNVFFRRGYSEPVNRFYGAIMILLSSFGLWIFAFPRVYALLSKNSTPAVNWFPLFIIANYLIMSMGLAIDTRHMVNFDELLNRPMVWAYFAVIVWTAGGAYYVTFGNRLPHGKATKLGLSIAVALCLCGPFIYSHNLQTFPARPGYSRFEDFNAVPLCLVKASQYILNNSHSDAIIQDSENDPRFILTALSERQLFAGLSMFGGESEAHPQRLKELLVFMGMTNFDEVRTYAMKNNIAWYLLQPGSQVSWPLSLLEHPAFVCDGYRVYNFLN